MFKIGVERGTSSLGNDKIFLSETKLHVKLTCPRLRLIPRWFPLAGNIRAHFCGAMSALWVSFENSVLGTGPRVLDTLKSAVLMSYTPTPCSFEAGFHCVVSLALKLVSSQG